MYCSISNTAEFSRLLRAELSIKMSMIGSKEPDFIIRLVYASPVTAKQCRKNLNAALQISQDDGKGVPSLMCLNLHHSNTDAFSSKLNCSVKSLNRSPCNRTKPLMSSKRCTYTAISAEARFPSCSPFSSSFNAIRGTQSSAAQCL